LDVNPAAGVYRPAAPPPRERTLSDAEIASFWRACDAIGPPFGPLHQFLLVTGQRRDEAASMARAEIRDGLWTIPKERTKNGREHTLPLPRLALELLDRVPRIAPEAFIFTTLGTRPISGFSRVKGRIDALMPDAAPWRVHDLRRTAATGLAKVGAHVFVIERVLNHISGSFAGIVGTYQRHKYLAEMKDALEKWADLIAEITRASD
jgi:integrase